MAGNQQPNFTPVYYAPYGQEQTPPPQQSPVNDVVSTYHDINNIKNIYDTVSAPSAVPATPVPSAPSPMSTPVYGTGGASVGASGFASGAGSSAPSTLGLGTTSGAGTAFGETTVIGAGEAIPTGWTAVGSAADGGTMIAPAAGAESGILAGLGTALAGGAVGAFYGPSYMKYGKQILSGDAETDGYAKGALLTNPITAWAVPLMDWAGIELHSGKGLDQKRRDLVRNQLWENKLIDDKHMLTLKDGTRYDIGKDGGEPNYNVDFTRPGIGGTVGAVNPLASVMTYGDGKLTNDFAGYLANALEGSSDKEGNLRDLYDRFGGRDAIYSTVLDQYNKFIETGGEQGIDADKANAYRAAIDKIYGVKNPNQGKGGEREGLFTAQPKKEEGK